MTLPHAVLWIDPGKMTGLALYSQLRSSNPHTWNCAESDFANAGIQIQWSCEVWKSHLHIGWEDFTVHPRTPSIDAHHALEIIGVARYFALRNNCHILTPAKPEQRKVATPGMLQALDWWVPGKDDAQSAAQHMLAWMLRTNNVPAREAGVLAALRG
jgi:hypothetical protein